MEEILDIEIVGNLLVLRAFRTAKSINGLRIVDRVFGPLTEVGRPELVAQIGESGIGA